MTRRVPGAASNRRGYWCLYVVLVRYRKGDNYEAYKAGRGGLNVVAHETRAAARQELREALYRHGRGNAYVQKVGAIS